MTHNQQAKELLKDSRLAKDIRVIKSKLMDRHYATCHIGEIGTITQWGASEESARANLRDHVTIVLKCKWPE